MSNTLWSVSRGSGGFKTSYEQVRVSESDGEIRVVYTTPVGVTEKGTFDNADQAISHAKEIARNKRFSVDEASTDRE